MFFNKLMLLSKSKFTLILTRLSILILLIFCHLYLMGYSTVICHENSSSKAFEGLETYERQGFVNNIIKLSRIEKGEDKEPLFIMNTPCSWGECLVEKLHNNSRVKFFDRRRKSAIFYKFRKLNNKIIRDISFEKQIFFKNLYSWIKQPFKCGKMNAWFKSYISKIECNIFEGIIRDLYI
ncbi:MAG: hypothetical protein ACTTG2_03420 [Peptostreptococcus stomatis]